MVKRLSFVVAVVLISMIATKSAVRACPLGCQLIDGWISGTPCVGFDPVTCHIGSLRVTSATPNSSCMETATSTGNDIEYWRCDPDACTDRCPADAPNIREASVNQLQTDMWNDPLCNLLTHIGRGEVNRDTLFLIWTSRIRSYS